MFRRRILTLSAALVVLSCAVTAGAQPAPKLADLIIGRWQGDGSKLTIKGKDKGQDKVYVHKAGFEFRKDGTFTYTEADIPELKEVLPESAKGMNLKGKYSFVAAAEIELVVKRDGKEEKQRAKVAVAKDELTLTREKDDPVRFKRIRD